MKHEVDKIPTAAKAWDHKSYSYEKYLRFASGDSKPEN